MASKKTAKDSAHTEKAKNAEVEKATGSSRKITDLSLGDIVLIPGFDGPRTICDATKVGDGADAGKFEVALRNEAGEVEHARFAPHEEVQVVGKAAKGGKASPMPAESVAQKPRRRAKARRARHPSPRAPRRRRRSRSRPRRRRAAPLTRPPRCWARTANVGAPHGR